MYLDLTESLKEKLWKYGGYEFRGNMILVSDIEQVLDDLLYEIHKRDEEIEDLNNIIQNETRPIKYSEMIGYSEEW